MDSPSAKDINPAKEYFGALYANISAWHTSIGGLKDGVHNFLLNSVRVNVTDEDQLVDFFKKLGWSPLLQTFAQEAQQLFVLAEEVSWCNMRVVIYHRAHRRPDPRSPTSEWSRMT